MLYRMQDRYDEALDKLNQALTHYGDDVNGQARVLSVIAHVHVGRGDPQAALPIFDEAIRLRRANNDPIGEATTLSNAAEAYHLLGRADTALELLHRSLLLRRETADLVGEAITNENMAEVYLALARPDDAKPHADAAIDCARRCDAREVERRALTLRARIWLASGNPVAARSDCEDGLALAATGIPTNLSDLRALAEAFRAVGDEASASKIDDELKPLSGR
jgi:tetratricopeptide (TPR) repeat protein